MYTNQVFDHSEQYFYHFHEIGLYLFRDLQMFYTSGIWKKVSYDFIYILCHIHKAYVKNIYNIYINISFSISTFICLTYPQTMKERNVKHYFYICLTMAY